MVFMRTLVFVAGVLVIWWDRDLSPLLNAETIDFTAFVGIFECKKHQVFPKYNIKVFF